MNETNTSQATNTYEAMFLVDAGNSDFNAASEPVRQILQRNEVQVLAMKPWDDRRLAFEIAGRRRGLYVLTYFQADPGKIAEIEHESQLDERVLRLLILRRDSVSEEEINAETPAISGARKAEAWAAQKAKDEEGHEGDEETDDRASRNEEETDEDESEED